MSSIKLQAPTQYRVVDDSSQIYQKYECDFEEDVKQRDLFFNGSLNPLCF